MAVPERTWKVLNDGGKAWEPSPGVQWVGVSTPMIRFSSDSYVHKPIFNSHLFFFKVANSGLKYFRFLPVLNMSSDLCNSG